MYVSISLRDPERVPLIPSVDIKIRPTNGKRRRFILPIGNEDILSDDDDGDDDRLFSCHI